ncbi:hypothetical protein B0A54_13000 [Friedmanniomyces endolithicus]|uniref:Uncharacterized protein n=1 Tax=Friedmanniomyces endolithicus TaxID=329885 RepID=A0A4U0UK29_9PEZI|nr:hypothetical protein LTS09_010611 [Friedmanniomyces endolithicus]TKA36061.1 hypothetical protein B0A54_13000 [Friedmanniomyces endolithicus]
MSAAFVERSSMSSMPQPNAYSHTHSSPTTRQSSWDFTSLLQEQPSNTIAKTAIDGSEKSGSDRVVVAATSRRKDRSKPRAMDNKGVLQDANHRRPLAGASTIESTAAAHPKRSVVEMLGHSPQSSSNEVKRPKLDSGRAGERLFAHGSRTAQRQDITTARRPMELIVLDGDDAKIPSPEQRRHPPLTRNAPVKPKAKSGLDREPRAKASGPFIIDVSSSDDEGGRLVGKKPMPSKKQTTLSKQPSTARPVFATSSESVQSQKLAQRLASKRMREEVEKRRLGLGSSRTSSVAPVASACQSGPQLPAVGQITGTSKQQQRPLAAQGVEDETQVWEAESVVILDSPTSSRAERSPQKSATKQAHVAPNTYKGTEKIDTNLTKAPSGAQPSSQQTPPHGQTAEQTVNALRELVRREREMAEEEKEAQAMREVDARIESEAKAREAEAVKREVDAKQQHSMRQEVQARRNAEAKRQQLQVESEVEARQKEALHDEDELRREAAREETELQAMREVDALIEAEAREREAEEMKEVDLRRQNQERKEILRRQLQSKKDAEAKWAQRLRDEEEAKKLAKERGVRQRLEAEEAKKAGDEARRKQQEVRDALAKRLAGPGLMTPILPDESRAGYSVLQSSVATREGAKVPESMATGTDAKVLPVASACAKAPTESETAVVAAALSDAENLKQERIRALKERNARYQHDAKASDSSSWNDQGRRQAEPNQQVQTSRGPASWYDDTRHEPGLSEQNNSTPLDVNPACPRPSESNHRRLHTSTSQLDQVASGDLAARTRLNSLVNGKIRATTELPVLRDTGSSPGNSRPLKSIGEITQSDIAVVRRRDGGMTFSAILPMYQHQSGSTFGESALRRRHAAVRTAIERYRADEALLNRVVAGDVAAKEQLNRMVYGTWPVPHSKGTPVRPRATPSSGPTWQSSVANSARTGFSDQPFDTSSTHSTRERSDSPFDSKPSTAATSFDADEEPSHRSTTAGKTMTAAAYERYLDAALAELHKAYSDDEEEPKEELTAEDLCHFTYSVQRREVSKEELDEGVELDELQWVDCGRPFTDLHRANTEANRQSAISNDPDTLAALIDGGSLVRDRDENGLVFATHSTKDAGVVEVRVERRLRTFKRSVRPKIDGGLVSRVVYSVRERTVKVEDHQDDDGDTELFGGDEARRTLLADIQVEEATYSTLELATDFAIKHFVKMAFRSASCNLDQRSLEEAQMRKGLLDELDEEGSDGMFRRTVEVEKGEEKTEVEVSVTKGPLRGPRNML